ncbi:MAG: hypothetical protein LBB87_05365 [Nitrososphaerota archaeon]|jgi:hypothetical protein|nr:hypothetical protein [Nitrososphaerota archaeon]
MKNHKKNSNKIISIFLAAAVLLLINVVPVSFGAVADECQVQVPLIIDLSHAIAGAQFTFEYSAGLEFVSYEKSAAVSSALITPVVVKNGYTHLGFYNADNLYGPKDGKLDIGCLVFNCLNDVSQKVALTEIKLVQVVNGGETRSEFLAPVEFQVSSENGSTVMLVGDDGVSSIDANIVLVGDDVSSNGAEDSLRASPKYDTTTRGDDDVLSNGSEDLLLGNSEGFWRSIGFWIAMVVLFVVISCASIFIIMKKRVNF